MGVRLSDSHWFQTPAMRDARFLIRMEMDDQWLEHRWNLLDFMHSMGPMAIETIWEYWRLSDERIAREQRRHIRERCPVCGGWRQLGAAALERQRRHPTLGMIACCRDCGWPHAENIYGSNIVYPGPRTGFRLSGL